MRRLLTIVFTLFLFSLSLSSTYVLGQSVGKSSTGHASSSDINGSGFYYEAKNGNIYVVNLKTGKTQEIHLFGVNWFGFETEAHVVYGLQYRNWKSILEEIKKLGFNAIRLPFCSAVIHGAKPAPGMINYNLNPGLRNLTSLQIMEKIVGEANRLGLYVLLDYHRIGCQEIEPLWYTSNYSAEDYISDWVRMAKVFRVYPNVIGADIKNEPHGNASWGTGDETDFRLFAAKAGRAILKVAPNWLIFVEGVQYTHVPRLDDVLKKNKWWPFWGENLMGVKYYPVKLPKDKVVYSPHVYGPSVYDMPYFNSPNFPENLPKIWETMFGYLTRLNYTIVIGEWGGRYTGKDRIWQNAFVSWLITKGIHNFFYWCLNPESRDTGGILLNDWKSVNWNKMMVIYRLIKAADPSFKEPLYVIINLHPNRLVFTRGSKVNVTWCTDGVVVESNFATSQNGTKELTVTNSTTLYIVAKKGNQTVRKSVTIYAIGAASQTNHTTSMRSSSSTSNALNTPSPTTSSTTLKHQVKGQEHHPTRTIGTLIVVVCSLLILTGAIMIYRSR